MGNLNLRPIAIALCVLLTAHVLTPSKADADPTPEDTPTTAAEPVTPTLIVHTTVTTAIPRSGAAAQGQVWIAATGAIAPNAALKFTVSPPEYQNLVRLSPVCTLTQASDCKLGDLDAQGTTVQFTVTVAKQTSPAVITIGALASSNASLQAYEFTQITFAPAQVPAKTTTKPTPKATTSKATPRPTTTVTTRVTVQAPSSPQPIVTVTPPADIIPNPTVAPQTTSPSDFLPPITPAPITSPPFITPTPLTYFSPTPVSTLVSGSDGIKGNNPLSFGFVIGVLTAISLAILFISRRRRRRSRHKSTTENDSTSPEKSSQGEQLTIPIGD